MLASGLKRAGALDLRDPRRVTTAIAITLFVVLLVPFGRLISELAPAWPRPDSAGAMNGLVVIAVAMLAAVPMVGIGLPAQFLSIEVVQNFFSWMLAAGVLMTLWLALRRSIDWPTLFQGMPATLFAAALASVVIYVVWQPISATLHNLALTPERLIGAIFSMTLALPFFIAFELLVRRGTVLTSTSSPLRDG
ncbi:MAG: hypothetical protein Q7S58_19880 [Candidatus Binatus sp.]|uniref:hypothetical protein n=1 Tax=Candidatus Binatus sp. TaxID=2811406 RepID=UPI0027205203|nr:hypothetical protein [Candidatus Binatus sp.]MDO8434663.1 hypothetical protein [Candidatus Binatus sp.]